MEGRGVSVRELVDRRAANLTGEGWRSALRDPRLIAGTFVVLAVLRLALVVVGTHGWLYDAIPGLFWLALPIAVGVMHWRLIRREGPSAVMPDVNLLAEGRIGQAAVVLARSAVDLADTDVTVDAAAARPRALRHRHLDDDALVVDARGPRVEPP